MTRLPALLLSAFFLLFPAAAGAQAPVAKPADAAATYEVRRGDTLFSISRRLRPEGATLYQVVAALYRANPDAFLSGSINHLREGAVLAIPPREALTAQDAVAASQEVSALIARPLPAPAAEPRPSASVPPVAAPAPSPAPKAAGGEEAERRYREGLALERRGEHKAALQSFLAAGEGGHGLAQKKLGELYDKGTPALHRDYETALRWYQKAREQGVPVPRPETRGPAVR